MGKELIFETSLNSVVFLVDYLEKKSLDILETSLETDLLMLIKFYLLEF